MSVKKNSFKRFRHTKDEKNIELIWKGKREEVEISRKAHRRTNRNVDVLLKSNIVRRNLEIKTYCYCRMSMGKCSMSMIIFFLLCYSIFYFKNKKVCFFFFHLVNIKNTELVLDHKQIQLEIHLHPHRFTLTFWECFYICYSHIGVDTLNICLCWYFNILNTRTTTSFHLFLQLA